MGGRPALSSGTAATYRHATGDAPDYLAAIHHRCGLLAQPPRHLIHRTRPRSPSSAAASTSGTAWLLRPGCAVAAYVRRLMMRLSPAAIRDAATVGHRAARVRGRWLAVRSTSLAGKRLRSDLVGGHDPQ